SRSSGGHTPRPARRSRGRPLRTPYPRELTILLLGTTAPYLPPHSIRRQEPSPFAFGSGGQNGRGTDPALRLWLRGTKRRGLLRGEKWQVPGTWRQASPRR